MGMREKFFSFWYPFRTNQKRHLQFSDKLTSKFSGHLLIMVSNIFCQLAYWPQVGTVTISRPDQGLGNR